jgi:hypothetical protein
MLDARHNQPKEEIMAELFTWGLGSVLYPLVMYLTFSIIPLVFILIKWRMDHDKNTKDPQVGLKVILYYFKIMALQVLLVDAAITVHGIIMGNIFESFSVQLAFLVVGGFIYGIHAVLIIFFTNRSGHPGVARYFTAYNIFISGIASMASCVMSIVFLAENNLDSFHITAAIALVYTITWAAQLFILFKLPLFAGLKKRQAV